MPAPHKAMYTMVTARPPIDASSPNTVYGPDPYDHPNPTSTATTVATAAMARVAFTGVLYVRCVLPNHFGSEPSRPMANIVRAAAVAQARQTTKADRIAAIE